MADNREIISAGMARELTLGWEALKAGDLVRAGWIASKLCKQRQYLSCPAAIEFVATQEERAGLGRRALQSFEEGVKRNPKDIKLRLAYAHLLERMAQGFQAVTEYQAVLTRDPANSTALKRIYSQYARTRNWTDASDELGKAVIAAAADDSTLLNLIANSYSDAGELGDAAEIYELALRADPQNLTARGNLAMISMYRAESTAVEIYNAHVRAAEGLALCGPAGAGGEEGSGAFPKWSSGRKLRVGYFCPDFRNHTVSLYFEPLIAAHDKRRVEVFCYSSKKITDAVRERIRGLSDHWRDLGPFSSNQQDQGKVIRQDRLDVLVDLAGMTSADTLSLFANRSAPVQISYLGYTNTTALPQMDYRITDEVAGPEAGQQKFYSEQIIRLPRPFYCMAFPELPVRTNSEPDSATPIRFGVTANIAKIQPVMARAWAAILERVPGSQIEFVGFGYGRKKVRDRIGRLLMDNGIAADRIHFDNGGDLSHFLAAHYRWTAVLDTFPVSGHTTTIHALCAGVPVVALLGESYVSRLAASVLIHTGLPQLVCENVADYVEVACQLALEPDKRRDVVEGLPGKLRGSGIFDAPALGKTLEDVYEACARKA